MQNLRLKLWFLVLTPWQQNLVRTSYRLLEREKKHPNNFVDYSFIVFSMAKAYEGFLKKVLFDLKLIDKKAYEGRRFRIGRALNPDMREKYRDKFWLYDDLAKQCGERNAR
ncbi:MAG: hypothetical protein PVJ09_02460, partial [Candidatus Woesebacteria bacterium]